ncbi:MAG TPA: hypothetical protein VKA83_25810 [Methylomirabilota bacterium]|nr:hypothetical protein [Methylomirabilota bacterium]
MSARAKVVHDAIEAAAASMADRGLFVRNDFGRASAMATDELAVAVLKALERAEAAEAPKIVTDVMRKDDRVIESLFLGRGGVLAMARCGIVSLEVMAHAGGPVAALAGGIITASANLQPDQARAIAGALLRMADEVPNFPCRHGRDGHGNPIN